MDERNERAALIAMICGLVSIFIFPILFGTLGIVLGYTVMSRIDDKESHAYSTARIGLIAGVVGLALWVVTLASMGFLGIDQGVLAGNPGETPSAF